jgi:hypothetical protein
MLAQKSSDIIDPRPLSRLINNAALKAVITGEKSGAYIKRMKKMLSWDSMEADRPKTVKDLIYYAYRQLLKEYRYEYLYKSALLMILF